MVSQLNIRSFILFIWWISCCGLADIASAQTMPDTDDTKRRQSTPPQPGWTKLDGSCDTSDFDRWAANGAPLWLGGSYPPPTGHTYFMSAGSWTAGGESAFATISGLTVGVQYTVSFYVAGFQPMSLASPDDGDSYRIIVGNEDSGSVSYNSTDWIAQEFTFTADSSSETITLYGPTTNDPTRYRMTHFSFTSNAVSASILSDYSDAPASYGDAEHTIVSGIYLGAGDPDSDGGSLASTNADGDDTNGTDDEDGVTLPTYFLQDDTESISVTVAGAGGFLQAWIDWNADGDFADVGEQIAIDLQDGGLLDTNIVAGIIDFDLAVPADATVGTSFARFRWSTTSGLDTTTTAPDGEVEDYELAIAVGGDDYGDAPAPYGSASHDILAPDTFNILIGTTVDTDSGDWGDGVDDNGNATDDDFTDSDDEDGFDVPGLLPWPVSQTFWHPFGTSPAFSLSATPPDIETTILNAPPSPTLYIAEALIRIDWDNDGDFANNVSRKFSNSRDAAGVVTSSSSPFSGTFIDCSVINNPAVTHINARIRSRALEGSDTFPITMSPYGHQSSGEVEDYQIPVSVFANYCPPFDVSDAPASYGDTEHIIVSGIYLGVGDPDTDHISRSSANADGDDSTGSDDEDGANLPASFILNATESISVTVAGAGGFLQAWIDWNADGDFADAGEQITTDLQDGDLLDTNIAAGIIDFDVNVPATATPGTSFARFRWSTNAGLDITTQATDGEVEDYEIIIIDPCDPVTSGNVDTDGDGLSDLCDLDDDNDGILDTEEFGSDPDVDIDGDGIPVFLDDDDNNAAIGNVDGLPQFDTDGDTVSDHLDLDSDNDGCTDADEAYANTTADNDDGGIYGPDTPLPTTTNSLVNINGLVISAGVTGSAYNTIPAITTGGQNTFQQAVTLATTAPSDDATCENGTAEFKSTLTVTANPATTPVTVIGGTTSDQINYDWQVSTDGGTTFTNITAAGSAPAYAGFSGTTTTGTEVTLGLSNVPLTANNYQYQIAITHESNICGSLSTAATLTVNATPGAPTATGAIYCNGDTIADITATGSETTFTWYSDAGLTTVIDNDATFSPTGGVGTETVYVTQTSTDGCESAAAQVDIIVNATPGVPTATGATYCDGDTIADITTTGSETTFTWYSDAGLTTVIDNDATFSPTGGLGTETVYVTQTSTDGCESAATQVDIIVNATPAAPTATGATYCDGDAIADITATGSETTFTWYSDAGLTTVIDNDATFSPTGGLGTETVYVTQTSTDGCESAAAQVDIIVNATPGAPTAAGATYCDGDAIADITATGSETTFTWYSDAGLTTVIDNDATFSPTGGVGTETVYVTQTSTDGCESPPAQVDIIVNATPAAPTATGATYCDGDTIADITATGSETTFTWYSDAGLTTVIDNDATFSPTGGLGTETLYVTQTSTDGCESAATQVDIIVNATPGAPTAAGATYCDGDAIADITATGSETTFTWYSDAGLTTVIDNDATFSPTGGVGTETVYVTQTSTDGCESPPAQVDIIVNATPAAPAAAGATYCDGDAIADITTTGSETTFTWYSDAGLTTVIDNDATFSPTGGLGTETVYVTQTSTDGCESAATQVDIIVNATPGAPTATGATYCDGDAIADITATGSETTFTWYSDAGLTTVIDNDATFSPTGGLGTETVYVTQTSTDGCESAATQVDIIVNATPAAPTAAGATYCDGDTIADITATGSETTFTWYSDAGLTTVIDNDATFSPTGGLGTETVYVTQTSTDGCESPPAQVDIIVNATPAVPTAAGATYCDGDAIADITATGSETTFTWYSDAGLTTVIDNDATFSPTGGLGTETVYVTQTSTDGCESAATQVDIIVNATPGAPTAAGATYCDGDAIADITATGSETTFTWYSDAGLTTVIDNDATFSPTGGVGTETVYVTQTSTDGCESPPAQVDIIVNATPAAPTATGATYCDGDTIADITATGSETTFTWYSDAGLTTVIDNDATFSPTGGLGTETVYVTQTSTDGCESAATQVDIIVNATPGAPTAAGATYCDGDAIADITATGSETTFTWYSDAGLTTVIDNDATFSPTGGVGTETVYVTQTSTDGCESPPAQVDIIVNATPAAPTATGATYCDGDTIADITATGSETTFTWYSDAGLTTVIDNDATFSPTGGLGTETLYVTQTSTDGCESAATQVDIIVNTTPGAPTAAGATYCDGDAIADITATGSETTFTWYSDAGLTTVIDNDATFSPTGGLGTETVYVTQTSTDGCESPPAQVDIIVNATPGVPTATGATYCDGDTIADITATGSETTFTWYSDAGLTTVIDNDATFSPTGGLGTETVYVTQTSTDGCESPPAQVDIIVNATPGAPTATGATYCDGDTIADITATGSETTFTWYSDAGLTTVIDNDTTFSPTGGLGTETVYVTQTSTDGCESPPAQVDIIVNATPAVPTAAGATYCDGDTIADITATGSETTFTWYSDAGLTTVIDNDATFSPTGGLGTETVYVTQTSTDGCESAASQVDIIVNATPAVPTATGATYCDGDTIADITATGSETTFTWYSDAGLTTVIDNDATFSPTGGVGTETVYVTQTSTDGCESAATQVDIIVNATPGAPTATGATYCDGDTIADITATGSETTFTWYSDAGLTTVIDNDATFSPTGGLGTETVYVTQTSTDGCESAATQVDIIVNATPAAPTAAGATYCDGDTIADITATGSETTFTWYSDAGLTTVIDNDATFSPTGGVGTETVYVTQTSTDGCESAAAQVDIIVNTTPAAPTAAGATYCDGDTIADITATGSETTFTWYSDAGLTTVIDNDATFSPTGGLGTETVYVTQTSTDGCESAATQVDIIVNATPGVPTAAGATYCDGDAIADITATGSETTFTWYSDAGLTTVIDNDATFSPTGGLGTETVYVTQTSTDGCESAATQVDIIVNATPGAPTAAGATYCDGDTIADITATGSETTFTWYSDAGLTTVIDNDATFSPTGGLGTETVYVTQTSTDGCESPPAQVDIIVNATPGAPIATGATYCDGDTIADITATGSETTFTWYSDAGLTTVIDNDATFSPTGGLGTETVYVTQTSTDGCESAATQVDIIVNATPGAPTAAGATYCDGDTIADITATGSETTFTWYSDAGLTTVIDNDATFSPTGGLGTETVYVTQTSTDGCESAASQVDIIVNATPAVPTATGATYCDGDTIADITATGSETTFTWYSDAGLTTVIDNDATFSPTGGLGTETVYVTQTSTDGCESAATQVDIIVNATPGAPTATGATYCDGDTIADITATGSETTFTWYSDAGLTTVIDNDATFSPTGGLGTETVYVTQTSTDGCESAATQVDIIVNATPAAPTAAGATYCDGDTIADITATGSETTFTWYSDAGLTTVIDNDATFSPTGGVGTETVYVTQTSTDGCESAATQVDIIVNATPGVPTAAGATYCDGDTIADITATGSETTFTWYSDAGLTTVIDNDATFSPTGGVGTETVYVTQTSTDGCESAATQVDIIVNATPGAPTATGATYCDGDTIADITATGSETTFTWYSDAGLTTVIDNDATFSPTGGLGTETVYVTQTSTDGCESAAAQVDIIVNTTPGAPTAAGATYCDGDTIADITATGSETTFTWYSDAGLTTVIDNDATFSPTGGVGTETVYVTQTSTDGCESAATQVDIIVNATPGAPTATGATYCDGDTIADITATGSETTFTWYSDAGLTTVIDNDATFSPTGGLGTETVYVTQTSTDGCESAATQVDIIVNATPGAPTAAGATYCDGDAIADITATGSETTFTWYSDAGLTTVIDNDATFSPTGGLGTETVYVTQTSTDGCESPPAQVDIIVNATPGAPTAAGATYCDGDTIADITATGSETTFTWYSDAGLTTVIDNDATFSPTGGLGTETVYVTQTSTDGCESPPAQVDIIVNATPGAPIATGATYCDGDTIADITATGSETTFTWYSDAGLTTVIDNDATFSPTGGLGTETVYVTQTSTDGCESAATQVDIIVNATPGAPTAAGATYCDGDTIADITATGSETTFTWYSDAGLTTVIDNDATFSPTGGLGTETVYVTQTSTDGCESAAAQVDIIVNATPGAPTAAGATYCDGDAIADITATGSETTFTWYSDAGLTTVIDNDATFSPTGGLGTETVYVTQTSTDGCESAATQVDIIVNATPGVPTAAGATYCDGDTIADITATGSETTFTWYSDAGLTTVIDNDATFSPTGGLGTETVYVTQTSTDGCESPPAQVDIIVNTTPGVPTAAGATYCDGDTIADITATGSETTFTWYSDAGLTTVIDNDATFSPTGGLGTETVYVTQTSTDGCESPPAQVDIIVNATPGVPIATGATYCDGDAIADITATGSETTFTWYSDAGLTTVIDNDATFSPTGGLGTETVYVTQTSTDGCESPPAQVDIIVNATPGVPIATGATYCDGDAIADITATGSETTFTWYSDAGLTTVIDNDATFSPTGGLGTETVYVTQTSTDGCESPPAQVDIIVNTTPGVPTAAGATYCDGDTIADITATGSETTFTWYSDAGLTTVIDNDATFSPTGGLGTETVYVTQTSTDGCESPPAQVDIIVNATPGAPTAAGATYCDGDTIADITATGSETTFTWYSDAGLTTVIDNDATFSPTGGLGTETVYVTQTSTDGCESAATQVDIIVNATPAAPTAAGATYCDGDTIADITATGSETTFTWYSDAGLTTVIDNDATFSPTGGLGTETVYVTQTSTDGCESAATQVDIIVNATPGAPTAAGATYCDGDTIADITATGSETTFTWYSDAGLTTVIDNDATFSPTGGLGTETVYVTQTSTDGCESAAAQVDIIVNATPGAPTATGATYCDGDTIADITATGSETTFTWYSDAGLTTVIDNDATFSPTGGLGTETVYVTQTSTDGCESPATQVDIIVNTTPGVPTAAGATYCDGDTIADITATGSETTFTWYSDAGLTTVIDNDATFSPTGGLGTETVYVTQTSTDGCESPPAQVDIIVNATPGVPIATGATYCDGDTIADITATGSETTFTWYSDAGLTTVIDNDATFSPTGGLGTETVYVTQTSTDGCESAATQVDIIVNATPGAPIASITQPDCVIFMGAITITAPTLAVNEEYVVTGITPVVPPQTNTSGNFSGLSLGDYEVHVFNTLTGCISSLLSLSIVSSCADMSVLKTTAALTDTNGDGVSGGLGDTIDYHFTIENTGNAILSNIILTDAIATVNGGPIPTLAMGATDSTTFTATYTITLADINAGMVINRATVSANDPGGNPVSDDSDDPNDPTDIDPDGDGDPDDPTVTALDGDSDGDGVPNTKEITDGTDPFNDCDFILSSQLVPPTLIWINLDCDGDGVTNGDEVNDNTDPLNPCEFNPASISVSQTITWAMGDCDGDTISNGDEIGNGDTDEDGHPDYLDIDDDNDGILSIDEGEVDTDGDGNANYLDQDADEDGIPDNIEGQSTLGYVASLGADTDGNGLDDAYEVTPGSGEGILTEDTDGDAVADYLDTDSDNDSVHDRFESGITLSGNDTDGDGLDDATDPNNDGYGDPNGKVNIPVNDLLDTDTTEDVDYRDTDDDGDQIPTEEETPDIDGDGNPQDATDTDGNNMPDYLEPNNGNDFDLEVFTSVTPNFDNDNDVFVIKNIELFPENTVEIFNRWGVSVYSVKGYGQNGNFFRGVSEGRRTIQQDKELPVGTYYYILEYIDNGEAKHKTGYIYINR